MPVAVYADMNSVLHPPLRQWHVLQLHQCKVMASDTSLYFGAKQSEPKVLMT